MRDVRSLHHPPLLHGTLLFTHDPEDLLICLILFYLALDSCDTRSGADELVPRFLRAGNVAAYDRRQGRCGKSPERTRTCRQSSFSLIQLLSTLIIVLAAARLRQPFTSRFTQHDGSTLACNTSTQRCEERHSLMMRPPPTLHFICGTNCQQSAKYNVSGVPLDPDQARSRCWQQQLIGCAKGANHHA
jgi:hypothetical protein